MTAYDLLKLSIPIPPFEEQKQIANYLDWKINEIDKLIEKEQIKLSNFNYLRKTLINTVVFQGLHRNKQIYKDTNLEWLNEVPKHWEIKKIGSLFTERREKVSDKVFLPLSVTKKGIFPQMENVAKSDNGDNRKKVCAGDFVINSRSDRKGSSGISFLDGSVSLINIVLVPKNINKYYINYLLRSIGFQEEFYRNGTGIVDDLWTTRYQNMKNIYLCIPPLKEQKQIANYLDWKINEIDKIINRINKKIQLLNELKNSIISEVVTGKIDVRDVVIPKYEKLNVNQVGKEDSFKEGVENDDE